MEASGAGCAWLAACRQGQADWAPPAGWLAATLAGLPGLTFLMNMQQVQNALIYVSQVSLHRDALETISLDTIDDRVLNLKCSRRQFRLGHHKMHSFIYNKN